jgi:hypothetical protein
MFISMMIIIVIITKNDGVNGAKNGMRYENVGMNGMKNGVRQENAGANGMKKDESSEGNCCDSKR